MKKKNILIVDDDANICELLSLYLNKYGFDTKSIADGRGIKAQLDKYSPDMVLLDLMLPYHDGYELCQTIRAISQVPIIMLSAKGNSVDKIKGLNLGADDYIEKPFDSQEVIARINSVLRRHSTTLDLDKSTGTSSFQLQYEGLSVNPNEYTVEFLGDFYEFPPKEFELLCYLLKHPNQVLTRDTLLEKIWGYEYIGDSRTIDVHIKRIRNKIKDHANWKIATIWGIGYKFDVK